MSRILVACEFSGTVRDAFNDRGFDAWSCDLLPDERGSNRHITGDVRDISDGEKLLACPFCGAEVSVHGHHAPEFWVMCLTIGCRAQTEGFGSRARAIAAWNKRATPTPSIPPALVEELRGLLEAATSVCDLYCTLDNEYARETDPIEIKFSDVDADDDGRPINYGHTICVMEDYQSAEADARLIVAALRALPNLLNAVEGKSK